MSVQSNIFQAVKSEIDIEAVLAYHGVEHRGKRWRCQSGTHDDLNPSGTCKHERLMCWSCEWNPDAIELHERLTGLTAIEAARDLSRIFGVEIPDVKARVDRREYLEAQRLAEEGITIRERMRKPMLLRLARLTVIRWAIWAHIKKLSPANQLRWTCVDEQLDDAMTALQKAIVTLQNTPLLDLIETYRRLNPAKAA